MQEIVRAAGLTGFRRLVTSLGADPTPILKRVGLDNAALSDPDLYIPYRNVLLAIEQGAVELGIPDFGLRLAAQQDMTFLGALALAIQSASSVRDGLIVAARHIHFHTPGVVIEISGPDAQALEQTALRFLVRDLPPIPQATEHAISHICKIVSVLSKGQLAPREIHFHHEQVAPDNAYQHHLGKMPVFGSDFDGINMRAADFRRRLPRHNEQLQAFVERFLIGAAPPVGRPLDSQVREVLKNLMRVQTARLQDVARVLRLHPRTLQRRLKDMGERFDEIHDEVRRDTIDLLLSQPTVPLATVASAAGFADQAVLSRACKRWFGETPRQRRNKLVKIQSG